MSRDLGLSYKTALTLRHKMREAMAEELRARTVGGKGKTAEIDSGYFGGYVKPGNFCEFPPRSSFGSKPIRKT